MSRRRWTGPRTLVVALAAAAASVLSLAPSHASGGQPLALGAEVAPAAGQTPQQAITSFETTTGHTLAFTRDYLLWNSPFPTSYEQWLAARGTVPMISVRPTTTSGGIISWASVAAAQPGDAVYAQMKAWADEVKSFGSPVYFTFNHEPEAAASNKSGTDPATYIAAWRNFHHVFDVEGVTNARWIWIMTSYAFIVPSTDPRYGWKWYPGDAYVDDLGADAYTFYTCNNNNPNGVYRTLAYQISGFVGFGAQHPTKPLWLPEFGVVENPDQPGAKAQWITAAQALFKGAAYGQFVGIAYFNENITRVACDWRVSTSATAQAAYNSLSQDPFYAGSVPFSQGDTTPPQTAITAPTAGSSVSGTISVNASATDDTGVASVGFKVDGTTVATRTTAPYTTSLDTSTLSNGSHTLTAVATDTSNNTTASSPVVVTVANAASTSCAATPAGSTQRSANLSLETNQSGWTGLYNASSAVSRVAVTGGYDGSWALQLGAKSGTTGDAGVANAGPHWIPGAPGAATTSGTTYTGSAELRSATAGQQVTIVLREVTPAGALVGHVRKTITVNAGGWHPISASYTAVNTGNALRYWLFGSFPAAAPPVLADCLSLLSTP